MKSHNLGLDHIHFIVKNLEESICFFELLGYKLKERTTHMGKSCLMQLPKGGVYIELQEAKNIENPGLNHIAFLVEDLDVLLNNPRLKGISIQGPVINKITGRRVATLRDTHGFLWQLVDQSNISEK